MNNIFLIFLMIFESFFYALPLKEVLNQLMSGAAFPLLADDPYPFLLL